MEWKDMHPQIAPSVVMILKAPPIANEDRAPGKAKKSLPNSNPGIGKPEE
jgi:hypothetical protein